MKENIKKAWVKALRSGEYKQGRGYLCATHKGVDSYCCLGVLANECLEGEWVIHDGDGDIFIIWSYGNRSENGEKRWGMLPTACTKYFDINNGCWMDILSEMNDQGKSFEEIADWIERYL
jgi:hypothetical protein